MWFSYNKVMNSILANTIRIDYFIHDFSNVIYLSYVVANKFIKTFFQFKDI